jgi:serine/threonine protein kinase
MAPELVKKLPYGNKVDIWALGVITYIMIYGKPPFKGKTKIEVFESITTTKIEYESTASPEAIDFCQKMLE